MPQNFHDFAKKYIDRDINDSCRNTKLPVNPRLGRPLRVTRSMNYRYRPVVKYFQIARKKLEFPPGRYHLKADPANDPAKSSAKMEGNWKNLPISLDDPVRCSEIDNSTRKTIVVTTFANSRSNNNYSLIDDEQLADRVTLEDGSPAGDGRSLDRCLIGTWRLDAANAQRLFDRMRGISSGNINIQSKIYNGQGRIDKHGNFAGSVSVTSKGYMLTGSRRGSRRTPVSSRGRVTGCGRLQTSDFRGGVLTTSRVRQRGRISITMAGMTRTIPMNRRSGSMRILYSCSGDTFTLAPTRGLPAFKLKRVSDQ